jgi:drug/metabolite transporter (DMT)-like permease
VVLSHFTLGEALSARDLLGAGAIAAGIALVHRTSDVDSIQTGAVVR